MKSNLLTSILFGLIIPWFYFLFVDVAPMDLYENGTLISKASNAHGVSAFIEFYGINKSLLIYSKVASTIFIVTFFVCVTNQFIRSKIEKEL